MDRPAHPGRTLIDNTKQWNQRVILRMNLEGLFHKYEVNVESHAKSLLEKLAAARC